VFQFALTLNDCPMCHEKSILRVSHHDSTTNPKWDHLCSFGIWEKGNENESIKARNYSIEIMKCQKYKRRSQQKSNNHTIHIFRRLAYDHPPANHNNDNCSNSNSHGSCYCTFRTGEWTFHEQRLFLIALLCYGRGEWKKISSVVTTRYVDKQAITERNWHK
jgi:hypothetical protein